MSFEDPILIFLLVSLFWTLQLDWVKPITISVSDTVIKSRNSWYIQQKIYTTLLKLLLRKPRWEYASSACIFHTAVLTCGVGRFTLVSCSCLVYTIYSFGKVARWVHLSSQGVHGIYKFIMRAKGMVYGGITSIHPHTSRVNACDSSLNEGYHLLSFSEKYLKNLGLSNLEPRCFQGHLPTGMSTPHFNMSRKWHQSVYFREYSLICGVYRRS